MSAEFVANMEDVLDLYEEPHDPQRPVVCFDETSTQLLAETRPPLPPRPGRPLRQDYEYRREGTRNLFLACEPLAGWRHVAVTERRTMQDFAHRMRWLVDEALPRSRGGKGRLGQSEHPRRASLYETFPAEEARRIAKAPGVPLHPQARELAEPRIKYGAGLAEIEFRAVPLLPEAAALRRGGLKEGSRRPGHGANNESHHQLALQHPGRTNQTTPPLPFRFYR